MKKITLVCLGLLTAAFMSICFGEEAATGGKKITIINKSGRPVYVYNYDYKNHLAAQPTQLDDNGQISLMFQPKPMMRIYFAAANLRGSIEKDGTAPDPFNFSMDATVLYSFVEYNYEPSYSRYTFNLSYIDEYSFPVIVKFDNVKNYKGCEEGFEYGFKSLFAVKDALKEQKDYSWDALIWPDKVKTVWDSDKYPDDMCRIIGPNKVWSASDDNNKFGNWVPDTYYAFISKLPKKGTQLFSKVTNWDGWQQWEKSDNPSPSNTGYVRALHSITIPDKNDKYGFFCYPNDNKDGEFTWIPDTVNCTVIIYPYDK